MKPKIIIFQSKKELYDYAASVISKQLKKKPSSVLGLSSGKTMIPLYKALRKKKINFSKAKTFNQDEYLTKNKKTTMKRYMEKYFLKNTNIKKQNMHLLPHDTDNPEKSCRDYQKLLKINPCNLQFLGLGRNGHIGFNEPGSPSTSRTRKISLTASTKRANKVSIKYAMTIGIADVLEAKKIVLIATGKHKAKAVKCMLKDKPSTRCPASALRKHKDVIILLDKDAASLL